MFEQVEFTLFNKDIIWVKAPSYHGNLFSLLVSCPDRRRFIDGKFVFLNSFSNIEYFLNALPNAKWNDNLKEILDKYYELKKQEINNIENLKQEEINSNFKFKTKPFFHQLKAFELTKDLPEFALLFEQGCGKTKVVIDTARYLFDNNKIEVLIIIAPNGVHNNWIYEEIPKHLEGKSYSCNWSSNMKKEKQKEWEEVKKQKGLKIFAFNVETFVSKKSKDEITSLLKKFNCLLAIDESQRIKNPTALRTKFLLSISNLAKYRRILTGTPVPNGVENIYTQFKFLNPNIIGISSYYAFKAKYCIEKILDSGRNNERRFIVGYKNIDDLQNRIKSHSMRVLKKDCLDLPDKIYQKEFYDMSLNQRKIYDEIKEEGISFLNNIKDLTDLRTPIIIDNILAVMTKLQQIASGYIIKNKIIENKTKNEIVELVELDKNPRIKKLMEILEQVEGKVVIWTNYTVDIDYIIAKLKDKAVRYDGKVNEEQRQINKFEFKNNPNIKYFVANLATGSTGLTLTEAETVIYYNNSYNLEHRLQSEDRCHRIGTTKNVNYIDICCNNTNDKKIIKALIEKKKISDLLLGDPKSFFIEE